MADQRIERDILINAPVEVVWAVVTEPEHIRGWFSEAVELDLRPGGEARLHWDRYGTVHGRVERVEPPRFFSFRWVVDPETALTEENSTLVEFSLAADGDATRLTVVESGFRSLAGSEDKRNGHVESHRGGWESELGELVEYAKRLTGGASGR
jgi:uncharacterized protein YndB with AHSA1/START domain